ncbi:hypothetical protein WICMUC_000450 [Wickerhamomyces mucosus]|uniref:nitrilase n=1 Tax=Wickerhamomyces mucosus TaxID=1378264 RepID=A0A9P8THZ1_9ASCO|nr:hypothetical protein WICMUC_000450 [Wickerhamomyces mucosus]
MIFQKITTLVFASIFSANTLLAFPLQVNSTSEYYVDSENFTVAAVRAAPANWPEPFLNKNWTGVQFDLNKTVEYGVELIQEASTNGANLIVFPECWFPGYPKGYDLNDWMSTHLLNYVDNSLQVGSDNWNLLVQSAVDNKIYLSFGFSERTENLIFMAQALIDPLGNVLVHRRKVRPSGTERDIWSDGGLGGFEVKETPFGRWGLLECWEHFHPAMFLPVWAQSEDIHIGSWPYLPSINASDALWWESADVQIAAARFYAANTNSYVVQAAVGTSNIFDSQANIIASIDASVSLSDHPLLYATGINTTSFADVQYNLASESAWGVVESLNQSWPSSVPKIVSPYFNVKENTIESFEETYPDSF